MVDGSLRLRKLMWQLSQYHLKNTLTVQVLVALVETLLRKAPQVQGLQAQETVRLPQETQEKEVDPLETTQVHHLEASIAQTSPPPTAARLG